MAIKAYFFSDLHISSIEEPKTKRLLNFFKEITSIDQMTHLFLVGDIFDLWVAGHLYFVEKFKPLIEELRRLHSLGVEIHYFEGNHDLYLEHFYAVHCGFFVHRQFKIFDLGGLKVRVEHGDEMDPNDRGYRFLRWFLRTPFMEWVAPRLPARFVVWLGERMSQASRNYTSNHKTISTESTRKVIQTHAERVWSVHRPFDVLIAGHVHLVEEFEFSPTGKAQGKSPVRVFNLGSWFDGARTLKLEQSSPASPVKSHWIEFSGD
jgi:UDP-2,3-diacylglucosamine hydrolase